MCGKIDACDVWRNKIDFQTVWCGPAGWVVFRLCSFRWQRDAAHSEWSAIHPVLSTDALLRQFGHRKLQVPAVVSHISIVGAEFRVFKIVAPHPGVLVVDRVDEDEYDWDGNYCDSHKSSYEGKVVLCNDTKQATY